MRASPRGLALFILRPRGRILFSAPHLLFLCLAQRKRRCAAGGGEEKENAGVRIVGLSRKPTAVFPQMLVLVDLTCFSFRCRCHGRNRSFAACERRKNYNRFSGGMYVGKTLCAKRASNCSLKAGNRGAERSEIFSKKEV